MEKTLNVERKSRNKPQKGTNGQEKKAYFTAKWEDSTSMGFGTARFFAYASTAAINYMLVKKS